ncbi:hypothetical protein [Hymenobacter negativus]|uniref:Uncharacterized protein n=1 Tax=Hymenobacter negativus TaxID=2795026 RepID=A0ABS3QF12_9BACT|nr:hypothetical protein [Hymenobacter negativus]MBO2009563.1 hypothetical protein [Hymenobacter negativus]
MNDQQRFFDGLEEIEQLPLFLTDNTNQLSKEIQINCIQLSIPAGLQIEPPELLAFLNKVKLNRQAQLQNSGLVTDLIYYVWHDELAGQLRFNFLSSLHHTLPFNCAISVIASEAEIVADFLSSNYLQSIPLEEFIAAVDSPADTSVAAFTCKVYQEIIPNSSTRHPR